MKLGRSIIAVIVTMSALCGFTEDVVETVEVPKATFDTFTNRVTRMWDYIHSTESNRCAFHGQRVNQLYDFDRDEPVLIITYEDGFKFEIKISKGQLEQYTTIRMMNQTKPKLMSSAQWASQSNNSNKTVRVLRSLKFGPGGKIIFAHDIKEK